MVNGFIYDPFFLIEFFFDIRKYFPKFLCNGIIRNCVENICFPPHTELRWLLMLFKNL